MLEPGSVAEWILTGLSLIATAFWLLVYLGATWNLRAVPDLTPGPEPEEWPSLTVIVPACNEAETIEPALQSLIAQDYPDYELIVVNDRSTDGTGEIIERLAAQQDHVRAVHVEALPERWLGKVHALHNGTEAARGDWLLFTDADVHYAPGALRAMVSRALANGLDHLTALPRIKPCSLGLGAMLSAFSLLFFSRMRVGAVSNPDSEAYVGVGAMNLVRREVFRRTPGWEWLRVETADDLGLGMMMKQAGGRCSLALAPDWMELEWYGSVGAMVRGLEKNSVGAATHYSKLAGVFVPTLLLALNLLPWLTAVGPLQTRLGPWQAGLILLSILISALATAARLGVSRGHILASPIALMTGLWWTILRSVILCHRRGGITWRGTLYPIDMLREGQRVKL